MQNTTYTCQIYFICIRQFRKSCAKLLPGNGMMMTNNKPETICNDAVAFCPKVKLEHVHPLGGAKVKRNSSLYTTPCQKITAIRKGWSCGGAWCFDVKNIFRKANEKTRKNLYYILSDFWRRKRGRDEDPHLHQADSESEEQDHKMAHFISCWTLLNAMQRRSKRKLELSVDADFCLNFGVLKNWPKTCEDTSVTYVPIRPCPQTDTCHRKKIFFWCQRIQEKIVTRVYTDYDKLLEK